MPDESGEPVPTPPPGSFWIEGPAVVQPGEEGKLRVMMTPPWPDEYLITVRCAEAWESAHFDRIGVPVPRAEACFDEFGLFRAAPGFWNGHEPVEVLSLAFRAACERNATSMRSSPGIVFRFVVRIAEARERVTGPGGGYTLGKAVDVTHEMRVGGPSEGPEAQPPDSR